LQFHCLNGCHIFGRFGLKKTEFEPNFSFLHIHSILFHIPVTVAVMKAVKLTSSVAVAERPCNASSVVSFNSTLL